MKESTKMFPFAETGDCDHVYVDHGVVGGDNAGEAFTLSATRPAWPQLFML